MSKPSARDTPHGEDTPIRELARRLQLACDNRSNLAPESTVTVGAVELLLLIGHVLSVPARPICPFCNPAALYANPNNTRAEGPPASLQTRKKCPTCPYFNGCMVGDCDYGN